MSAIILKYQMILIQVLLKRIKDLLSEKDVLLLRLILPSLTILILPHAYCSPSTAFFPIWYETTPNYLLVQKHVSTSLQRKWGFVCLFCLLFILPDYPFSTSALVLPTKIPASLCVLRYFAFCYYWPLCVFSSRHLWQGIIVSCLHTLTPNRLFYPF